jgi:hypothetical protein
MIAIPTQTECARCEQLFCYFRVTNPRVYCSPCVKLELKDTREFHKALRYRRRMQTLAGVVG